MKCEVIGLKICMIGLGSIGKRHLKNIQIVLQKKNITYQIDALRSNVNNQEKDILNGLKDQYYKAEDLPNDYDIIFVTNPTSMHYCTIQQVASKTNHMFIEKPIFDKDSYDIEKLALNENSIYYVACPLRHKNIMKYLKENIISKEKVISCRIISSSYLPNWRKNSNYRKIYSAQKELGGGVTRDLIHEWDYAIYLFGIPQSAKNIRGHYSDLEIDSDDVSIYIAKYQDMLLEMHLDYIGHKTERTIQLFTNTKRIDVDLIQDEIVEYQNNEEINRKKFDVEDFYLNEMNYFIDCVNGKIENVNSICKALETLKIALGGK